MERLWLPEDECRLTLLACLEALGPVTEGQLTEFVGRLDLIGYFDMALNLGALEDQRQVRRERHPAGLMLGITEEGARALEAFRGRIPASRRALILREAPAWRARFARQLQAPCRVTGREALLMLLEGSRTAAELRLTLPEGCDPEGVRERWEERAPQAWRTVTAALWGDGTAPETMPEGSRWERLDSLTGLLTLEAAAPGALSLRLALREESEARRCAARWPLCREPLERDIRRLLEI